MCSPRVRPSMRAALLALVLLMASPASPAVGEDVRAFSHLAASGYDAAQLADAYALAGDGAGVRVGIVTWGPASEEDFDAYAAANGLPSGDLAHHGDCSGGALAEWDLDAQMVKAAAPRAEVHVFCAPRAAFADLQRALDAAIAFGVDVVSMSWGTCEDRVPPATAAALHRSAANASARGIALFAASGDGGSRECTRWSVGQQALRTAWPATSPLVVAVGGTRLSPEWSETAWNACAPCPDAEWSATGGGVSVLHEAPWWQGSGMRESPDVAAVADRGTGVAVRTGGAWLAMGGTSAATPLWAGAWAALVGEVGRTGPPGPLLYAAPAGVWRDVVDGTNGDYAAGPGRDLATGWGGLQGAPLLAHLAALPPPPANVTATAGPARGQVSLAWQAVEGASSYVVLRGSLAGDERPLATVDAPAFVDDGLPDGSAWSYRVVAVGGRASLPQQARAFDRPAAPGTPVALPTKDLGVRLTWDAPADDGGAPVLRYRVWRGVDGAPAEPIGVATARAFEDADCPPLARCAYSVAAENLVGEGARSGEALAAGLGVTAWT